MKLMKLAGVASVLTILCTQSLFANPLSPTPDGAKQYIAVGQEGRGYERRGKDLTHHLRKGWGVKNHNGSEDIARAVCENPNETPVGIAQVDAVRAMEAEGCSLRTVGVYPSKEYAIILFPPNGANELSDLTKNSRVLVDEVGSGTALFWQTIVSIETGEQGNKSSWSQAKPVYDNIVFAESMADTGEIDAVILVGDPHSNEVKDLLNTGWSLGELYDKDIDDEKFRKGSLYTRETVKVQVTGRWFSDTDDAVVVRSYFIVNKEWSRENPKQVKRIARIVKALK